jgi:hypothetical protein
MDGLWLTLAWSNPGWRFHAWESFELPHRVDVPVDDDDRTRVFDTIAEATTYLVSKYAEDLRVRIASFSELRSMTAPPLGCR